MVSKGAASFDHRTSGNSKSGREGRELVRAEKNPNFDRAARSGRAVLWRKGKTSLTKREGGRAAKKSGLRKKALHPRRKKAVHGGKVGLVLKGGRRGGEESFITEQKNSAAVIIPRKELASLPCPRRRKKRDWAACSTHGQGRSRSSKS